MPELKFKDFVLPYNPKKTLGSSNYKYYVLHLSKEPFPKNVTDLEVVKTARSSLLHADFNVWKKVTTVVYRMTQYCNCYLPFLEIEIRIHERKTVSFDNFQITDSFGK